MSEEMIAEKWWDDQEEVLVMVFGEQIRSAKRMVIKAYIAGYQRALADKATLEEL